MSQAAPWSPPPRWKRASKATTDLIKCAMGFYMLKKGMWINNIVGDEA